MSTRATVEQHIASAYRVQAEHPWLTSPEHEVFRHAENKKWFAIIMRVKRSVLGLEGDDHIDIMNVKCDEVTRAVFLRESWVLPAYHMNKEKWITILLDGSAPESGVELLLRMSHELTSGTGKAAARGLGSETWLVPANPKYYDIEHAFDRKKTLLWKQSANIKKGSTVYMYVGAPVSAILYKCEAVQVDIPYNYSDENLTIKKLMKLRLVGRYDSKAFTYDKLCQYGVNAIRGPRGIPEKLRAELESYQSSKR